MILSSFSPSLGAYTMEGPLGEFGATASLASLKKQAQKYRDQAAKAPNLRSRASLNAKAAALEAQIAKRTGKKAPSTPVPATPGVIIQPAIANTPRQVQADLVTLGKIVNDSTLTKIKVDGAIGPATAKAVNRALTKYAAPGTPAAYRTGKLTAAKVKGNVAGIAAVLELAIRAKGGTVVTAATVMAAKAVTKAAPKAAKIKTAKISKVKAATKRVKAQQTRLAHQAKAKQLKAQAAIVAKRNPAQAQALQAQAAQEDAAAQQAMVEETAATVAVATAAREEQAAVQETAAEAASAITPTPEAAAAATTTPAEPMEPAAEVPGGFAPPAAAENRMTIPEESFFAKYKMPIIGVGVLAALGVGFLAMRKSQSQPRRLARV